MIFVDARDIVDIEEGTLYIPSIDSVAVKQYYRFPLTGAHELKAIARLTGSQETGSATLKARYRRQITGSVSAGIIAKAGWEGIRVRGRLWHELSDRTSGDIRVGILDDVHAKFRLRRKFSDTLTQLVSFKLGTNPKASLGFHKVTEKGEDHIASIYGTQDAIGINWRGNVALTDRDTIVGSIQVKNASLDTTSFIDWIQKSAGSLTLCLERTISQLTRAHLGFSITPLGIFFNFGVTRLGQTFQFPLLVSSIFSPVPVLSGILAPVALYLGIAKFILEPRRAKNLKERDEMKEEATKAYAETQKEKAKTFIELMEDEVKRKQEIEDKNGGLVIVQAFYGKISPEDEFVDENNEDIIDVTIPLQYLVKDSRLELPAESKSTLIGFYDPCPNEEKYLQIHYLIKQQMNQIMISDISPLTIPVN